MASLKRQNVLSENIDELKRPKLEDTTIIEEANSDETVDKSSNENLQKQHYFSNPNFFNPSPRDESKLDEHRVPKDWVNTTKFGSPMFIEELPFVILPIKCPIENPLSVKQLAEKGSNFTWPDALTEIGRKFKNIEKVLKRKPVVTNVIDLTGTELNDRRYYRGTELYDLHNIRYTKVRTNGGGGRVPHGGIINKFSFTLNKIRSMFNDLEKRGLRKEHPDFDEDKNLPVVIIHCTHGVNRTGFMISMYLIRELNMDPEKAMNMFEKCRGYPIKYENYKEELRAHGLIR